VKIAFCVAQDLSVRRPSSLRDAMTFSAPKASANALVPTIACSA
jgi:hypothetical protein